MAATPSSNRANRSVRDHASTSPTSFDSEVGRIALRLSTDAEDAQWDDFLESTPLGHYQQSAAWAQYKATEGWSVIRAVYSVDNSIVGGFQILWKNTKLGRLAYASKGPVLHESAASLAGKAIAQIKQIAVEVGLTAVIVQPPDDSRSDLMHAIAQERFVPCSFLGIIESTLLVDLAKDTSSLAKSYRRTTRNERNQAIRAGLTVRDGDGKDIPEFFRLMLMTCQRQGVHPNPPTEESVRALWESLNARRKRAHFKFTVFEGDIVSGDLTISFGRRATLFKTGWNGRHSKLYPNNLRVCETIEWAAATGHLLFDFTAFGRELAERLLQGKKITPELNKHRDAFKARYGGYPKLLPAAGLWIRNPVARLCFLYGTRVPLVQRAARMVIG